MKETVRIWGRRFIAFLVFFTLLGVIIFLNQILFPFVLACFLAYVLAPVIDRIHQWKIGGYQIPRGFAVIMVYLLLLDVLIGGGFYLIPNVSHELTKMLEELPEATNRMSQTWLPEINKKIGEWATYIEEETPETEPVPLVEPSDTPLPKSLREEDRSLVSLFKDYTYEIRQVDNDTLEIIPKKKVASPKKTESFDLKEQLISLIKQGIDKLKSDLVDFLNFGRELITVIAGSVFTVFLTFMVSAFILVDVDRILNFVLSLFPGEYHEGYRKFLSQLDRGLNGVVRGQLIICLVNGTLTGIGLLWIGIPFAFTLSIVATVCSLIPIFGTILSSVPIVVMALAVSPTTALLGLGWVLVIHFLEANFFNPKIMGTSAEIHPALIVFALVAGEYVAGIAGALLAVPIFSILQTTFLFLKAMIEELVAEAEKSSEPCL